MERDFRHFGALAALLLSVAVSGCANTDVFDSNEHWFSQPFTLVSRNGGYTYSELKETNTRRPITAADLVDASGACPPQAGAPTPTPGDGIALGMSECDVVYRAGAPASLQLGNNPNGDRTLVLNYNGGPRPGIYRFERGRLAEMDEVAVPPPPAAPKVVKRKKPPHKPEQASTQ